MELIALELFCVKTVCVRNLIKITILMENLMVLQMIYGSFLYDAVEQITDRARKG